ncbi:hypothetical protein BDV23DRAFT_182385 [Aspergillus alliaceus]|uniref:Uncharacterized protein n=1 Tax=Petromyces alliaceus TaxID=209559 RepID=A0A5N7CBN8_PETAA|nr:hypothetical protein BDV23DRAFT_182385 [Aspergillus alliaceus]
MEDTEHGQLQRQTEQDELPGEAGTVGATGHRVIHKEEEQIIAEDRASLAKQHQGVEEDATMEQAGPERGEFDREAERAAAEQAEQERAQNEVEEHVEQERLTREAEEQTERERLARVAAEQAEQERIQREAEERAAVEQAERQRLAREAEEMKIAELVKKMVREAEQERIQHETAEREAAAQVERDRMAREAEDRAVAERVEQERLARELEEKVIAEQERLARETEEAEQDRLATVAAEQAEQERIQQKTAEMEAAAQAERDWVGQEAEDRAPVERVGQELAGETDEQAERDRLAEEAAGRVAVERAEQEPLAREAEEKASTDAAERVAGGAEQERATTKDTGADLVRPTNPPHKTVGQTAQGSSENAGGDHRVDKWVEGGQPHHQGDARERQGLVEQMGAPARPLTRLDFIGLQLHHGEEGLAAHGEPHPVTHEGSHTEQTPALVQPGSPSKAVLEGPTAVKKPKETHTSSQAPSAKEARAKKRRGMLSRDPTSEKRPTEGNSTPSDGHRQSYVPRPLRIRKPERKAKDIAKSGQTSPETAPEPKQRHPLLPQPRHRKATGTKSYPDRGHGVSSTSERQPSEGPTTPVAEDIRQRLRPRGSAGMVHPPHQQGHDAHQVTILFKARGESGEWDKVVHELVVDASDPSPVARVAKKDARNKKATFFDTSFRTVSPGQCYDAVIAVGTNTILMAFGDEVVVNEDMPTPVSRQNTKRGRKAKHYDQDAS